MKKINEYTCIPLLIRKESENFAERIETQIQKKGVMCMCVCVRAHTCGFNLNKNGTLCILPWVKEL